MSGQHQEGPRQIWLRNITGDAEVTDSGDPLATEYVRADVAEQRIAELERERDELAAHAGRMAAWIKEHGQHSETCDIIDLDEHGCHKACSCGLDVIDEIPCASLARRDMLVMADALEEFAAEEKPAYLEEDCVWAFYHLLLGEANRLRHEAEGGEV